MADISISFAADTSALQGSLSVVQDAVGQLGQSFADTSAISGWSAAVSASSQSAATAVSAAAQTIQIGLTTHLDPIGASAAKLFSGLISGGESFGQAFEKMGVQLLSRFVGWAAEMAERWAVSELAQSAASSAGSATRAAVAVSAQGAGMAASGAQALADIGNSGARAAAGAYAAVASVPVIGPVLAPAAAATALAAVLEFGGQVFSAAGGWGQVPYDGALTSLHKDEMVLPSSLASPLRSALGGESGGGSSGGGATHHHWNISALDAQSFARLARSNPDAITGALTAASQRLSLTPDRLARAGSRPR